MKKYKLKTAYPCLIVSGQQSILLNPEETLELQDENKLLVYPVGNARQSIAFTVELDHLVKSCFYTFHTLRENEMLIFFPSGQHCENYILKTLSVAGKDCNFEIGQQSIILICNSWKKVIHLQENFVSYKLGKAEHIAYILLQNENNQIMYALNTKNGNIKVFTGSDIQINQNTFRVFSQKKSVAGQELQQDYEVTAEGIRPITGDIQYQAMTPRLVRCDPVIPYAFLEAMQLRDFELARAYLSAPLRQNIDIPHLKSYFGQISQFYHLEKDAYYVLAKEKSQAYRFCVTDGKISEIEEI